MLGISFNKYFFSFLFLLTIPTLRFANQIESITQSNKLNMHACIGCCHEEGNIFIILTKPLRNYLQHVYKGSDKAQAELEKIDSLEFIVQHRHSIYAYSVKDISISQKILVKDKELMLNEIIGDAIINNTIVDFHFIKQEQELQDHLNEQKNSGKLIELNQNQERMFSQSLLALSERTDKELRKSIQ